MLRVFKVGVPYQVVDEVIEHSQRPLVPPKPRRRESAQGSLRKHPPEKLFEQIVVYVGERIDGMGRIARWRGGPKHDSAHDRLHETTHLQTGIDRDALFRRSTPSLQYRFCRIIDDPVPTPQYLADAELNWVKLITMWQSWDANKRKERMEWAGVYKFDEPNEVPRVARDLEHLAGFDMTVEQSQKILELQLAISNLEYMRMMLSAYTDF